jgi:hypothetical protein
VGIVMLERKRRQEAGAADPQAGRRSAATPCRRRPGPGMKCPAVLGVGRRTKREFCDILSGRTPARGLIITLPPHRGDVTLMFDLHNRHTYSEEVMKAEARLRPLHGGIGALAMDNTLIRRAAIQTEFRVRRYLFDRIGGGAGPAASGGRAGRRRAHPPAHSRSRERNQPARRERSRSTRRRQRDLQLAGAADRGRQQRDDRVSSGPAAASRRRRRPSSRRPNSRLPRK